MFKIGKNFKNNDANQLNGKRKKKKNKNNQNNKIRDQFLDTTRDIKKKKKKKKANAWANAQNTNKPHKNQNHATQNSSGSKKPSKTAPLTPLPPLGKKPSNSIASNKPTFSPNRPNPNNNGRPIFLPNQQNANNNNRPIYTPNTSSRPTASASQSSNSSRPTNTSFRPPAARPGSNGILANVKQPSNSEAIATGINNITNELPSIFKKPSPKPTQITPQLAAVGQKYLGFSLAAYGDTSKISSEWRQVRASEIGDVNLNNSKTGMQARVYENRNTGEAVLAFRGTDPHNGFADIKTDLAGIQDKVPQGGLDAIAAGHALKAKYGDKLTITGHSLGGAYATAAGISTGTRTYSFDPPGFGKYNREAMGLNNIRNNEHLITNFNGQGNFVNDADRKNDNQSIAGDLIGQSYFYSTDNNNAAGPFQIFSFVDSLVSHIPSLQYEELEFIATGKKDTTNDFFDALQFGFNILKTPGPNY